MKDLFVDCQIGLSSDMLLAAFLDLGVPKYVIETSLKQLGLNDDYKLHINDDISYGIKGVKLVIKGRCAASNSRSWKEIESYLKNSSLDNLIKEKVLQVFQELAIAESLVHGCEVGNVHFHEIGSNETLIKLVGVCSAVNYLRPKHIFCMYPPAGHGNVRTSHGILPVPSPTVFEMARKNHIKLQGGKKYPFGELTTPTGLALMIVLTDYFDQPSILDVLSIGIGLGSKDTNQANFLRICEIEGTSANKGEYNSSTEISWQPLICQEAWIDDASPEDIAELINQLRINGAIDVASHQIEMKKGRLGINIKAIVSSELSQKLRSTWFLKGTSIGLRESSLGRWLLPRRKGFCNTSLGAIAVKQVKRPDGTISFKPENSDLIRLSNETGKSLDEIRKEVFLNLDQFSPSQDWTF